MKKEARPQPSFPFIVGCGRSGTTLLVAMLDSHPDLAIPSEAGDIILRLCGETDGGDQDGGGDERGASRSDGAFEVPDIAELVRFLASHHRFLMWGLDARTLHEFMEDVAPTTMPEAIRALYSFYARSRSKLRYADKSPNHVLHMLRLKALFPEARFIHMIRDGRDVALAMRDASFGPDEIAELASHWASRVESGQLSGVVVGPGSYLEVRYEDLISDPVAVLTVVAEFIGIPYSPVMLDYFEGSKRQIAMSVKPEEDKSLLLPLTAHLRDWRTQMDPDEIAMFESVAGPDLERLGYRLGGRP